jgi:hypothetical protein
VRNGLTCDAHHRNSFFSHFPYQVSAITFFVQGSRYCCAETPWVKSAVTANTRTLGPLWIYSLRLVVPFAIGLTVANAQTRIGAGNSAGSDVRASESIGTGSSGQAHLRQLDNNETAMLVRRGKDFLKEGDLTSARLLLQRAATAGSAEATFILARRSIRCLCVEWALSASELTSLAGESGTRELRSSAQLRHPDNLQPQAKVLGSSLACPRDG